MNRVTAIGRLADDPALRSASSGKKVCSMRLAITRRPRGDEDQGSVFIDLVAFDGLAVACSSAYHNLRSSFYGEGPQATMATMATIQPTKNHLERNRPTALRSGWRARIGGASTAPRCLNRKARLVASAEASARISPKITTSGRPGCRGG